MHSPHRRAFKINNNNQRASFCTCQGGSYTIEAAVVIPLLAGYLVTILYFFTILEIQYTIEEALIFAGRKTAVESCVTDSEELLFLSAEAYLLYALEDKPLIERFVKNGALGIFLWGSEFHGEEIVLRADYEVKLPITMFGIGAVELFSQNHFYKWTKGTPSEGDEAFVYITETGEVYHSDLSCRSIHLSIESGLLKEVSELRGKNGQKYYECSRCEWKDEKKERIYYTDYGTLYHKDIQCSSLKRTVIRISIAEIGDRRACSFCYGL